MPIKTNPLPSVDDILRVLDCDPHVGSLVWRRREGSYRFNGALAGKPASKPSKLGYSIVTIAGKHWLAHRIIWKVAYGADPKEIDHINGDKLDNRIANLREADRRANMRNRSIGVNNSSGKMGVTKTKEGAWRAYLTNDDGVFVSLGYFSTFDEAAEARDAGIAECSYHPNHGRIKS